jgi:hypothetical protein
MNTGNFYKMAVTNSAQLHGWTKIYEKERVTGFYNELKGCHLDVYINEMRVITCLEHPKGTTVLERVNIGFFELAEIFKDPRKHTSKGKKLL